MEKVSLFRVRAQQPSKLAAETNNPRLKAAYEAIATEMMVKAATANPKRDVTMMAGVVVDLTAVRPRSTGRRPRQNIASGCQILAQRRALIGRAIAAAAFT